MHPGADPGPGPGRARHELVRSGISGRGAAAVRLPAGTIPQGGPAHRLPALPLAIAQDQRGTLRDRRQRGAGAASRRRHGLQSGAARCRQSRRARRRAPGRSGSATLTAAYDDWRAADRREIIGFTDGLVRLFSAPWGPVRHLRNLGLLAFDLLPPAKAALSSLSTGATGRIPKLARGVPIGVAGGERA